MNWKKLIGLGLLFWVIVFVIWLVLDFIPGLTHMWQWIIGGIVDAVVVFFLAKWYFKSMEGVNFSKGLLFGLGILVIGNILDVVISVPFFLERDYAGFYGKWELWLSFGIVLVFAGLGAMCKARCKKEKPLAGMELKPEDEEKK